jgi:hypothetical protein
MRDNEYEFILEALRSETADPKAIRDALEHLLSSEDRDLRIYLGDVLQLLASSFLPQANVKLPLHQPPFEPLVAYCERQVRRMRQSDRKR